MDADKAKKEIDTWKGVNKYIVKKAVRALSQTKEVEPKPVKKVEPKKVEEKKEAPVEAPLVDKELLEAMTKEQLDLYAAKEHSVDLDRRKKKEDMIKDLLSALKK